MTINLVRPLASSTSQGETPAGIFGSSTGSQWQVPAWNHQFQY